mgnify:CR=1 FL=1
MFKMNKKQGDKVGLKELNREINKLTWSELMALYNMIEDATMDEDQIRYNERNKQRGIK